jgi:uncharacterized coiled-coil DUF342 family protein
MDLDYSDTQILGVGLAILAVVSLGYTYGVSQDIDSFLSEEEVSNAIQEREDAVVDSFNEVVNELEGDINETQDSVDSVSSNLSETRDSLNQTNQEVDELEQELNDTETELQELRDWVRSQATVAVSGFEDLGNQYRVSVMNTKLEEVEGVIVQAQLGNTTNSKLIQSIESGETATVTFSKPSGSYTPEFTVQ